MAGDINPKDPASHIDASLKTLHTKLANDLVQARLSLVRMRNKISSQFHSLPKNILAEIFMNVFYTPATGDRYRSTFQDVRRISRTSIICLPSARLGERSALPTRRSGLLFSWAADSLVVPKKLATTLSIQRSKIHSCSTSKIHLVAMTSSEHSYHLPYVEGRIPTFDTIRIQSKSARTIMHLLDDLTKSRGQ
ncbi:hypothetical protein B0J17DRAFT_722211 [Rhizoctonia solani]|nr:hypothetical protein B0J17DRAFT_722211 [Rhizoctonia solani]